MENPSLTFVSPSILAGDRSLAFVVAHEISHSWTGNLVTNRNWVNFWLNEGFTVFTQRKISELIYGEDMANLEASVQYKSLEDDIQNYGVNNNYTSLHPDIGNRDPDDAYSTVPYEKGATFLYYLQSLVTKPNFQKILQEYVKKFRLQSIDYLDFKNHFESQVRIIYSEPDATTIINQVDWNAWIFSPGYPPKKFEYSKFLPLIKKLESKFADDVNQSVDFLLNNTKLPENFNTTFVGWHTNLKLFYLNQIRSKLDKFTNDMYNLLLNSLNITSTNSNMEVENLWYLIGLKKNRVDILPFVEDFLSRTGRMKFIRPMYMAYAVVDRQKAINAFNKNK